MRRAERGRRRATALIIIYKNLNKKEQVNLKLKYMPPLRGPPQKGAGEMYLFL